MPPMMGHPRGSLSGASDQATTRLLLATLATVALVVTIHLVRAERLGQAQCENQASLLADQATADYSVLENRCTLDRPGGAPGASVTT